MAKGESGLTGWVVKTLFGVMIVVSILPFIMSSLNTLEDDTTNFTAVEIGLISLLSILIILGIVYKVMKSTGVK